MTTSSPYIADVFDQRLTLPEELYGLAQLRASLSGWLEPSYCGLEAISDITLLRFLRGYTGDVKAASHAFRTGMEWRIKHQALKSRNALVLEDLETKSVQDVVEHYTDLKRLPHWGRIGSVYPERFFVGRDKTGNPIMYMKQAFIENPFALMTVVDKREYDEFRVARMVNLDLYLYALSVKCQKLIKSVYVWNLDGMTRSLWKQWELPAVKAYWGNWDHDSSVAFPEQAHRIAAVNVPSWLMILWTVIKRVIPGRTLRKVTVVGSSGVAEALLRLCEIPKTCLPKEVGGTMVGAVGLFARPKPLAEFCFGKIEIPAGTSRVVEFDVSDGGVVVCWGVHVQSGRDIILSVDVTATLPKSPVTSLPLSSVRVEDFRRGVWEVPDRYSSNPCTMRFRFDNHSSLFFSKSVEFFVCPFPEAYQDAAAAM